MSIDTYPQLDRHFQGYARVKLEDVNFDSGRDLDGQNVDRLIGIFQLQGCERENTANAISVLVEKGALRNVLTQQGSLSSGLHSIIPDQLPFLNTKVLCLQGKHRICAARTLLRHPNRWWTAKIFDADLPLYAQEHIRHETPNALKLSNGDIFRHHLAAERRGDKSADKWFGMLAPNTQGRVRQLKKDVELLNSFLDLLPFAGLWPDCDMGPLTRELPMRCREEQHCYLRSIHQRLTYVLGPDVDPHCLDLQTVRLFEVLMPANSSCDARVIHESMRTFKAFPRVRNPSIRKGLQARLLSCERILTLKSFHRDTIVLEGCYQPLRQLFPVEETTLQRACMISFEHDHRYFRANYIDLWLHVLRNHPYLSDHPSAKPIQDRNEDEPVHYLKSEAEVSKLVSFAASRGFWTFDIGTSLPRDHVPMQSEPVGTKLPKLSCKKSNIQPSNRSSRPRACDFEQVWKHLSLQSVFEAQKQPSLKYPTAFAVVKDIVRCFWGSVSPSEIANPDRMLRVEQYMEQHDDLSRAADESQASSSQDGIAADSGPMQGVSQKLATLPRSASSKYSDSGRLSSATTFPGKISPISGEFWGENDFTGLYHSPMDISSTEDESNVHDGSHQANAFNGDIPMRLSSNTRSDSRATSEADIPTTPPQDVELEQPVKVNKGPDRAERVRKAGRQGLPQRVEKSQQYTQKKRLRQQQTRLERALQRRDDDHVQTVMRKAEEHMRSAHDAVAQVHDDSSVNYNQTTNREGIDGGINDMVNITTDTMSDVFPGGRIRPASDSGLDLHEPVPTVEASRLSETQAETSEEGTSRQDKRKPIYHITSSVQKADNSVLPKIQATQSHVEGPDGGQVNWDTGKKDGPHLSMFPGGSLGPYNVKQVTTEAHSSSQIRAVSKKRLLANEIEHADVHLGFPKPPKQVQLSSWTPFEEIVDSIRRIWKDLDHARIYVTSPIEIEELSAQQLPNQRLWSWPRGDKELFNRLISSLLAKKFGFQVVSSDAHSKRRQYGSLEHMEYWNTYFGDNRPGYWLAVLTPWRTAGSSREKVRNKYNDGNS